MEKSVCVEKLAHSCGSKDGLQVFQKEDGSYDGYCFACSTFVANPYEHMPGHIPSIITKSEEEVKERIGMVETLPTVSLGERGLKDWVLTKYGVKVELSTVDGVTPTVVYFPYKVGGELKGYKARLLSPKKMWCVGSMKSVDMFGWEQALNSGAKRLYITEGCMDAMALYQMLKESVIGTKWEHIEPAVVSLPMGASSVKKAVTRAAHKMRQVFQEVVYVPDNDHPGKEAADLFARLYPGVYVAELPCKDPNACLLEGKINETINAIKWRPSQPKNTRILLGSSLKEEAKKAPEMGLPWPWEGFTKATRGRRRGEVIYFGAGAKCGKSELVDSIAAHIILVDKLPVFLVKPEQDAARTYRNLVGKAAGRIFHDPNIPFDHEAFDNYEGIIGDKAIILDSYQFVNWDTLKDDIRYVVTHYGVQDIILDPITCFTNTMSSAETNEFLVRMAAELSSMAKDLRFTAYIFCHLKAPTTGEPHERGGKVLSTQFTGSRAMMRSCNLMVGMEGNKDPDLPIEERNVRTLVILEDREFGSSEKIRLFWDRKTGLFSEIKKEE